MQFLFAALPVLVIVGFFVITFRALQDAAMINDESRILWMLIILLLMPFGAVIYYVIDPRGSRR